jgi:hypothetical protein
MHSFLIDIPCNHSLEFHSLVAAPTALPVGCRMQWYFVAKLRHFSIENVEIAPDFCNFKRKLTNDLALTALQRRISRRPVFNSKRLEFQSGKCSGVRPLFSFLAIWMGKLPLGIGLAG